MNNKPINKAFKMPHTKTRLKSDQTLEFKPKKVVPYKKRVRLLELKGLIDASMRDRLLKCSRVEPKVIPRTQTMSASDLRPQMEELATFMDQLLQSNQSE